MGDDRNGGASRARPASIVPLTPTGRERKKRTSKNSRARMNSQRAFTAVVTMLSPSPVHPPERLDVDADPDAEGMIAEQERLNVNPGITREAGCPAPDFEESLPNPPITGAGLDITVDSEGENSVENDSVVRRDGRRNRNTSSLSGGSSEESESDDEPETADRWDDRSIISAMSNSDLSDLDVDALGALGKYRRIIDEDEKVSSFFDWTDEGNAEHAPTLESGDSSDEADTVSPYGLWSMGQLGDAIAILEASRKDATALGYDSSEEFGAAGQETRHVVKYDDRWNSSFQLMRWSDRTKPGIKAARYISRRFRAGCMKGEETSNIPETQLGRFQARRAGEVAATSEKDKLTGKCFNTIALFLGGKSLREIQYNGIYSFITNCLKCLKAVVVDELLRGLSSTSTEVQDFVNSKIASLDSIFEAAVPLLSLTNGKRELKRKLKHLRLRSKLIVCTDPKGRTAKTKVVLPSEMMAADMIFDETCTPLLERPRCSVKYAPVLFYDCPLAAKSNLLSRPAPFGALADKARGNLSEADPETGIPRSYTSRLFAQGSKLAFHTSQFLVTGQKRRALKRCEGAESLVKKIGLLPNLVGYPEGDPVVINKDDITFTDMDGGEVHEIEPLLKWTENADIVWPLRIVREQVAPEAAGSKRSARDSKEMRELDEALRGLLARSKAYLCHTFVTSDGPLKHSSGSEKFVRSIVFIGVQGNADERQECTGQVEIVEVEVLADPQGWVKGELRPVVGPRLPNPYRLKRFDQQTGAQKVIIPIILYTDKFKRGDGKKAGMAGYYYLPIGMQSHFRSGAQAVRILSATSDGMDPNTPIFASVEDLQRMENCGKLMHTSHGPKLVYFKVVGFNVDYVQAAESTHSLSHSATCPCTICAFRRGQKGHVRHCEVTGSASLNICINQERLNALKGRDLEKVDFVYVGVKEGINSRPLEFLDTMSADYLPRQHSRPLKPPYNALLLLSQCSGANPSFEYTLFTLPAPDHCGGFGLSKGTCDLVFCALPEKKRKILEERLLLAMKTSGLQTPKRIQRTDASVADGFVGGLSVTFLSSLMSVLPVVLLTMKDDFECKETFETVKLIVSSATEILALLYFTPRPVCNTLKEAKCRYDDVRQISDLAAAHLMLIKGISVSSRYSDNLRGAVIKFCDNPNLHRFFEICCFWLPAVGYDIYHLAEIIFEKTHQFVKRYAEIVPKNIFAGLYAMLNYLNDLTLRRIALAYGKSESGPGGDFAWKGDEKDGILFQSLRGFYNPATRSSADQETDPVAHFLTVRGERTWEPVAWSKTIEGVDMMRIKSALSLSSAEVTGRYRFARFGRIRDPAHYSLGAGNVVSGITTEENMREVRCDHARDQIVRLRVGRISEVSQSQTFGESRVTVLIKEIWGVKRQTEFAGVKSDIKTWVYGHLLLPSKDEHAGCHLPVFDCGKPVWIKLDASCRRQACFPLRRIDDKYYRPEIVGKADYHSACRKYVVLGQEDGYPGRCA